MYSEIAEFYVPVPQLNLWLLYYADGTAVMLADRYLKRCAPAYLGTTGRQKLLFKLSSNLALTPKEITVFEECSITVSVEPHIAECLKEYARLVKGGSSSDPAEVVDAAERGVHSIVSLVENELAPLTLLTRRE